MVRTNSRRTWCATRSVAGRLKAQRRSGLRDLSVRRLHTPSPVPPVLQVQSSGSSVFWSTSYRMVISYMWLKTHRP